MDNIFLDNVARVLNVTVDMLKEDSTAQTIPEWDSLNHWRVVETLEDVFGVEFTMDEATEFKNLGDIYKILMEKVNKVKEKSK